MKSPTNAQSLRISSIVADCTRALVTSSAQAHECATGKADVKVLAGAPPAPVGLVYTKFALIDLAGENVKLHQRGMRLRRMTIAPGDIVPLHNPAGRPALIKVNADQIHENSSKYRLSILHKADDVARDFLGTRYWRKNKGSEMVDMTIDDIANGKKPETMSSI